jgi:hypothetical protein
MAAGRPGDAERLRAAPGSHSMTITALLAAAGLGQVYNRQTGKGVVFLLVWWVAIPLLTLGILARMAPRGGFLLGIGLGALWWLTGVTDAVLVARRLNRGEAVAPWSCFNRRRPL